MYKKILKFLILILVAVIAFGLVACVSSNATVTFNLKVDGVGDNQEYNSISLKNGEELDFSTIHAPEAQEGYSFVGWETGGNIYKATDKLVVTKDITLKAVFALKQYTVTFLNADNEEIVSLQVAHGVVPQSPAFNTSSFKQYVNITDGAQDKFSGWTVNGEAAVLAATTSDVTYKAFYTTETRSYTVTFAETEFAEVLINGIAVASHTANYNTDAVFSVKLKQGAVLEDNIGFWVNAVNAPLTESAGQYTLKITQDCTVTIGGLVWARYDTVISSNDSSVNTEDALSGNKNSNFGVVRGGSFRFKAKGVSGYEENAPTVKYLNNKIEPEQKTDDGWYVYLIANVCSTDEVNVSGFKNYIPIRYIQADDSEILQNWTISTSAGIQGSKDAITGASLIPGCKTARVNGVNYSIVSKSISWTPHFYLTTDPEKRFITAAEATAWINSPVMTVPQKGDANIFYFVYGIRENATARYIFTLPDGYTNLTVLMDGVPKAPTFDTYDGNQGYTPMFGVDAVIGSTLTVSFDQAYGAYQNNGESVEAANKTYTFIVEPKLRIWVLDTDYVTVNLPLASDRYNILAMTNNNFNVPDQLVPLGANLAMRVTFKSNLKTDVMLQYEAYCNAWQADGFEIEVTKYPTKDKMDLIIKNITADCQLTFTPPQEHTYQVLFAVDSNFTYRVDGKNIVPEHEAQTVSMDLTLSRSIIALVPTAPGATMKSTPTLQFFVDDGNETITTANFNGVRETNGFNWVFTLGGYSDKPLVEHDHPTATDQQKVHTVKYTMTSDVWSESHFTKRYDVEKEGGKIVSKTSNITNGGNFTVTLTAPTGKTPTLFVEFNNKKDQGFIRFDGVKSPDANNFTFTVANVTSNIRWYILLATADYEVKFMHNEQILVQTVVPHGTSLTDINLPQELVGEKDGVMGTYQVTGWRWKDGAQAILIDKAGVLEAILGAFTPYQAKIDTTYYKTVGEAIASLSLYQGQIVNIDVLVLQEAPTLNAGRYTIPKNVVLRLPYAVGGYGEKLATAGDNASAMYADPTLGTVRLIVEEGANIEVFGAISVGAIVGIPRTNYPYQGHISSYHAILQLDGTINLHSGGSLQSHGTVVGDGSIEAFAGGVVYSRFVVKDYRGGSNSSNVFSKGIAPFNVYEMPYVQVNLTFNYGALEVAYANLFADNRYNATEVVVLGKNGIIQPAEGGKIVKKATMIQNARYAETTKHREPPYEFRIRLDVYGGGTDGVMTLLNAINTKNLSMSLSYIYDIHLHSGKYQQKNAYKIMPGGTLTVESGAELTIVSTEEQTASLTSYSADFRDNFGGFEEEERLLYPPIDTEGKLIVNGKLIVKGKLGASVFSNEANALIEVFSMDTYLSVEQVEGIYFSYMSAFAITYQKVVAATASGVRLEQGGMYRSEQIDGKVTWARSN